MSNPNYKPYLDGFRGISILIVAISHGGFGHIVPGGFGLTVFFFISGYLITSLLLKEKDSRGFIGLPDFYMRRLWRLIPALVVYIAVSLMLALALHEKQGLAEPASALFYYSNYYKLFIGYDRVGGSYSPYDVLWSLAVEEHFYLFFAPLVAFIRNRKTLLKTILFLLVAPLLIRALATHFMPPALSAEYAYRATDARIDSIAYGCLLAVLGQQSFLKLKSRAVFALGVALILLSLLIRDEYFRQVIRYTMQGVGLYLIFSEVIYADTMGWARKCLSGKFIVFIGKLSYSMYLYHWLGLILMVLFVGAIDLGPRWQAAYWAVTMALSALSYYVVERPTLKLRVKYGSNAE